MQAMQPSEQEHPSKQEPEMQGLKPAEEPQGSQCVRASEQRRELGNEVRGSEGFFIVSGRPWRHLWILF